MYHGKRIIVIIPAFNEEDRIGKVLEDVPHKIVDTVVVVDDGSTDRTAAIAKKYKAKILPHKKRQLLGAAIRTGIDFAINNNYDIIVIMTANGKDDPKLIPKLIDPIVNEDYDYIQGSRYLPGGFHRNMPLQRILVTKAYPILLRIFTGFPATDGTNGFRAYKTSLFKDKRINIWQKWLDSTASEFYLSIKVMNLGYRVKEVPVSKIYPKRVRGRSYTKVRPFIDWWNCIKPLVYLTLRIKK